MSDKAAKKRNDDMPSISERAHILSAMRPEDKELHDDYRKDAINKDSWDIGSLPFEDRAPSWFRRQKIKRHMMREGGREAEAAALYDKFEKQMLQDSKGNVHPDLASRPVARQYAPADDQASRLKPAPLRALEHYDKKGQERREFVQWLRSFFK